MAALTLLLHVVCLTTFVLSEPAPARIPKVYNALITSNQNLEPSKAYPIYQPVIQESAFGFPFQPVFYGSEFPGVFPVAPGVAKEVQPSKAPEAEAPKEEPAGPPEPNSPTPKPEEASEAPAPVDGKDATPAPPLPPNTQSPIPLNEFGLPPVVFPLGRLDPTFEGFTQVSPFYSYPGLRFYDPYDAYNLYNGLPPLYRSLPNVPARIPLVPQITSASAPPPSSTVPNPESPSPPTEPSDLNILNYSAKDPAIPNVPPPPLPEGGLKSDKSE